MRRLLIGAGVAVTLALVGSCSRDLPSQSEPQTIRILDGDSTLNVQVLAKPGQVCPFMEITFALPVAGRALLTLHNVTGYKIATLFNDWAQAGFVQVLWQARNEDGKQLKSGLYYFDLVATTFEGKKFFAMCSGEENCEKMYDSK